MKLQHQEFIRYQNWKDRFLEDYGKVIKEKADAVIKDAERAGQKPDIRLERALISMYVGGYEKRIEDPDIKRWTDWAGYRTYSTFNGFPQLSGMELSFLFYSLGKVFVPLLLHERGVKSESFKQLSPEEQEKAVVEELDVIWENHLIRILQIMPFLGFSESI